MPNIKKLKKISNELNTRRREKKYYLLMLFEINFYLNKTKLRILFLRLLLALRSLTLSISC